jgi:hypothetical protein
MALTPAFGFDTRSQGLFKIGTGVCAALLGMQCIWLLLPELVRPKIDQLPTNLAAATAASTHYDAAVWAATVARIRGDLWAELAFTQADLLWRNKTNHDEGLAAALQRARTSLDRALRNAPHTSGGWLMLAGLTSRISPPGREAIELLKLSYYTGPSDHELVPLRLEIAMRLESFDDIEIGPLVSRDIRLLLARKQDVTIAEIYNASSASAKRFMELTIRDIDASAFDRIRAVGQKQPPQAH